jgi:phage terminase large subunit-like protein
MNKGREWAQIIKESYTASQGGHVYGSLFQGEPTDMEGNLFKIENWEEYEIAKMWVPEKFDRIYLSIDASFKDKTTSDFVAMKVGGIRETNDYLRYLVRKRLDFPDTLDKIIKILKKFPEIDIIYIEDKANGSGIVSVLRKWRRKLKIDEHDFPSVYPLEPNGGKYSRAQTSSAYQRDGKCFIPCEKDAHLVSDPDDFEWEEEGVSYTNCFKTELGTFPFAANDDLVDCFSQAININIPLLTGEEKVDKKPRRFLRYTNWWPEMWQDFKHLKTQDEKNAFIRMHGAPIEWKPKSEGGEYGVV